MRSLFLIVFLASLTASAQQFDTAAEQDILRLLNADRAQSGLAPLELDDRLTEIARQHSAKMVEHKALSHQFADEPDLRHRVISSGIRFDTSGENVAFDRDADSAERALMNSPPHRANILSPAFTAVGIGVIRVGDSIYVTQDFAHRLPEFTPEQAENVVSRAFEHLRRSADAPLIPRVSQPALRNLACEMAQNDRLDSGVATGIANVRVAIAWTASEPGKLPADMQKLKTVKASGWSVGACFASSQHYQNPVWWMLAVTYF
ncbi:MAG TPA: CAP domain-containing protein [Terriglobales bacterium]|nr:CAP domain-containing protein [Terriglobales bacterium]